MKSTEQTAVIGEMSPAAVEELLELATSAPIKILSPPKSGLSMMHVLDAYDSEFLLGEVLVTRAEVELDGLRGFGMVTGDSLDRALARACAEVLLQGKDQLLKTRAQRLLEREQKNLEAKRQQDKQLIASTKVNFDLLAGS